MPTALLDVEEDVIQNIEDVIFVQWKHLPPHPDQKSAEKDTLYKKVSLRLCIRRNSGWIETAGKAPFWP
jgi:hypothetical protein